LYFTLLATCHECVVETKGENSSIIEYEGPSPDEICLVSAARQHHYVHLGSTSNTSIVHTSEGTKEFELVTLFSFDNKRKMMSVLIKHEGVYKLLVKGADSAIISRLNSNIDQPFEI
jgi:magnesium-transporting ATPase (P-type)